MHTNKLLLLFDQQLVSNSSEKYYIYYAVQGMSIAKAVLNKRKNICIAVIEDGATSSSLNNMINASKNNLASVLLK